MDAIAQRQQSERDALAKRHAIEVEKFRLWVEAEIVNACHSAPPDPNQPIRTAGRLAHHASACEYFLKQRYGSDVCAFLFITIVHLKKGWFPSPFPNCLFIHLTSFLACVCVSFPLYLSDIY